MTINNNSIHSQSLKFRNKNFDNWCIQIHILFRYQDLWDLVNIGYNKVTDLKEFKACTIKAAKRFIESFLKKINKKTLYIIFQAIDESIFEKM